MAHLEMVNTGVVSRITWEGEEKAKAEFFAMMDNHRKEMEEAEISRMQAEGEMHPVTPVKIDVSHDDGNEDLDSEDYQEEEERKEEDDQDNTDNNDPLAPYRDETLNICFKGFGGVQIDFAQRKGSEARNAVKVLFAQQKGKFPLTIQRIVETEGDTEYEDIITIAPQKGQGSPLKGASAGTSTRQAGKTPEQLAEIERKRKEREEAEERKRLERAAKAELREKTKAAELLAQAMKAARNAPEEGTLAAMQFDMLHRPQGATYGELGLASNIVNGGWKTTIRQFGRRFNKLILAQYRSCEAKPGIKTYAAYKLIDNTPEALVNIPSGWVIDPTA